MTGEEALRMTGEEVLRMTGVDRLSVLCHPEERSDEGSFPVFTRLSAEQKKILRCAQDDRAGETQDDRAGEAQDDRAGETQDDGAGEAQDDRERKARDDREHHPGGPRGKCSE